MTDSPAGPPLAQTGFVPQTDSTVEFAATLGARMLGLVVLTAAVSGATAVAYRWYVRDRVPTGLGVLFGLTVVVAYLGTTTALSQVIGGEDDILEPAIALVNIAGFGVGWAGAYAGTRLGDRLGTDLFAATGGRETDADVSEIVQTVGRVTSLRLPDEIEDIVGYDPMPEATKETLAGRRFLFPRRLTKTELRDRLVSRLKTDYGVGHVDLELSDDGTVDYLAVGSRAAGIGPTLPPSTNAVAVRADPANAASAGDLVQVWETNPMQRVLTGELRGVAGEVVTVAIDAADTPKLDPTERYKLVTLPVQDRPDREFTSLLRAADETMGTVTVEPGSSLEAASVGELGVTVAAITRDDEPPVAIPSRDRPLSAGDVLYIVATPDALRRIEAAAESRGADGLSSVDAGTAAVDDAPKARSASAPAADEAGSETGPAADSDETVPDGPGDGDDVSTGAPAEGDDGTTADETETDDPLAEVGTAAPDSDGQPMATDDTATQSDEASTDGDVSSAEPAETSIPDTDAFPDQDDLPGLGGADGDQTEAATDDTTEAAETEPADAGTDGDTDEAGTAAADGFDAGSATEAGGLDGDSADDPTDTDDDPFESADEFGGDADDDADDDPFESLDEFGDDTDDDVDGLFDDTDEELEVWDPEDAIDADDGESDRERE